MCINILHTNHDIKDKLHILQIKMQKLSNRKGLSTVITTLIILVVAVLLAGVVTYYATNVVMTRTTQEEVRIRKPHIWVQEGDNAYAALMVQNLGGRDVLIDKLTIRGVNCPWGGSEVIEQGTGSEVSFSGTLINFPIVPGSLVITDGVETFSDDGLGVLAGDGSGTPPASVGAIDYVTGVWSVQFAVAPIVGVDITADYDYGVDTTKVYYYLVQSGEDISGDFVLKSTAGVVYAQIGTVPLQSEWATAPSDIPLKSSGTMLFFITNPTNIALNDVGTTISLTVYTSNAQWIVETIVQAAEIVPVA